MESKDSAERVSPEEAVSRLRHLVSEQDIGVIMATTAYHNGTKSDISREKPSIAAFHTMEGDAYIGNFLTGFGFFNVRFPKDECRYLTLDELEHYAGSRKAIVS